MKQRYSSRRKWRIYDALRVFLCNSPRYTYRITKLFYVIRQCPKQYLVYQINTAFHWGYTARASTLGTRAKLRLRKHGKLQGTIRLNNATRRNTQPLRLSKNTACSPNMFQNHHGALSRSGEPQALSATDRSIFTPMPVQSWTKSLMVQWWMLGVSYQL